MAVNRVPVLKRCRSLGLEPAYLGYDKKSNRTARTGKKMSEYGLQLREKQKAKFIYMLLCVLVGGVTGFLSGSGSTWLTSLHLSITLWICSIVCLVLLPVSMRFSVQWMAEKEY